MFVIPIHLLSSIDSVEAFKRHARKQIHSRFHNKRLWLTCVWSAREGINRDNLKLNPSTAEVFAVRLKYLQFKNESEKKQQNHTYLSIQRDTS